jgi:hypothetical protein
MRFITDQAVDRIAALEGVDLETRRQAFDDADRIYAYLRRSEGQREGPVPEGALRKWGEQNELGPDRLNLALEVLKATDRVVAFA